MPFGDWFTLLAQAPAQAPAPAGDAQGQGSLLGSLAPFLPIPFLYYFLILRPQQAAERKKREAINALKKHDRVLTQAGIYGTVVSVSGDGDKIVLRVSDDPGVKMEFSKAAIVRVVDLAAAEKDREKVVEKA